MLKIKEIRMLVTVGAAIFLYLFVGCAPAGGGGGSNDSKPKPTPPPFEVTAHQLYLVDHGCLADCGYGGEMECVIENCLATIDDDLLCRGDIILPEVFGYNKNANTTHFWYVIDFTDGLWENDSMPGATEFVGGENFRAFPSQAYYITDPDTYRMEIWLGDANGNKTKPYHVYLDFEGCEE